MGLEASRHLQFLKESMWLKEKRAVTVPWQEVQSENRTDLTIKAPLYSSCLTSSFLGPDLIKTDHSVPPHNDGSQIGWMSLATLIDYSNSSPSFFILHRALCSAVLASIAFSLLHHVSQLINRAFPKYPHPAPSQRFTMQ